MLTVTSDWYIIIKNGKAVSVVGFPIGVLNVESLKKKHVGVSTEEALRSIT